MLVFVQFASPGADGPCVTLHLVTKIFLGHSCPLVMCLSVSVCEVKTVTQNV